MYHINVLHAWSLTHFCLPSHSVLFHPLPHSFPTLFHWPHPPHNTAHLFLITSCHYWSPRLPLGCGHSVLSCHMKGFQALTFRLISCCQPCLVISLVSTSIFPPWLAFVSSGLCLLVPVAVWPSDCELCPPTCGLWCFTVSNLVITSTTLLPSSVAWLLTCLSEVLGHWFRTPLPS